MKINKDKLFYLLSYTGIAFLLLLSTAQAQQPASVGVSPASIDAKVKPGASYTQDFTLSNNTPVPLRFNCSASDLWYDGNNNRLNGQPGTLPRSASLWMQFTPSEIVVEPHSSAKVKAVITTPQTASGSYFTVPVFEAFSAEKILADGAVQTGAATASIGISFHGLMMLTTEEGAEYNLEIMSGQIQPPTASREMEINLDLRNRGNAHAKVRGAFAILDSFGNLAGRGNIEEKRYLPAQRSNMQSKWSGELPPGNYTCVVTLSYNRVGMEPASLVYEIPFTVKK